MNLNLPRLPLATNLVEQVLKVREECGELVRAVEEGQPDVDIAQEVIDVIQSAAGVLQLLEGRQLNVEGAMVNHRIKLLNRGWQPQGVHNVRVK